MGIKRIQENLEQRKSKPKKLNNKILAEEEEMIKNILKDKGIKGINAKKNDS